MSRESHDPPLDLSEQPPHGQEQSDAKANGSANGKRGSLYGGALTEEALASSRRVLSAHRGDTNQLVGLQQFFSPPQVAELIAEVFGGAEAVLDPTAGSGALLAPFAEDRRFGVEIDPDHAGGGGYHPINADAQKVVPMMRAAGLSFPAVALNPPFGLAWRDPAYARGEISSTALAYLWALDLMDLLGQGAMVCGRDRLAREVLGKPEGEGVYAVVEVEGALFEGVKLPTAIAFFVQPARRVEPCSGTDEDDGEEQDRGQRYARIVATGREQLPELCGEVVEARRRLARHVSPYSSSAAGGRSGPEELSKAFAAVAREHERRAARARDELSARRYDATLAAGKVSVHPSAYAKLALAKAGRLRELELLSGQHPAYFAQNPKAWQSLEKAADEELLSIDPALRERAEKEIAEGLKQATPLFPVKPQMRLGWLTELDKIRCTKSDPDKGYEVGLDYPLATRSKVATETDRRAVENKYGEPEIRQFTIERKLLEVRIGKHAFDEGAQNISYIDEHFELPDPGCVATSFPGEVARNRRILDEMELEIRANYDAYKRAHYQHGEQEFEPFSFKEFQKDHLARLLVKRRGMLAHEQGLGKSLEQMALVEAQRRLGARDRALFVVPQDLIPQWQREAGKFFGRTLEEIRTPARAREVAQRMREGGEGWFITYYEALSIVGRKKEVLPEQPLDHRAALARRLADYKKSKGSPTTVPEVLASAGKATTRDGCPECGTDTAYGWDGEVCGGDSGCGYVHRSVYIKPAYSHLTRAFEDGVKCVDEVSEIRGDDSLRSKAVRALARGPHNFGATGTPVSNYINDAFWGLWFSLGNASAAFPYDYQGGKAKFESDFCVIEYEMGKDKDGESHKRKRKKVLPQVTNVSQFWRLTQPGVSRCRKEQTGEPLVERTYHPVRVPMGAAQQKSHSFWLSRFTDYFSWKFPDHTLVKEGLVDKWAAALGQLWRLETAATLPDSDGPSNEWPEACEKLAGELSNYTPAALKTLELAMEHAQRGEKVLVGSDLIATGNWLSERLREKGVNAVHITEETTGGELATKNPRKRSREVSEFTAGDAQVLCAGVGALKLGHNLDVASTVIVHGLPYSFMALDQFIARVHRLTSEKPVSVYVVVPKGSLAERKWELLKDKGGSSDLAFDGELQLQPEKAIDWSKVLKEMAERGITPSERSDEAEGAVLEADIRAAWERTPAAAPPAITNGKAEGSGSRREGLLSKLLEESAAGPATVEEAESGGEGQSTLFAAGPGKGSGKPPNNGSVSRKHRRPQPALF